MNGIIILVCGLLLLLAIKLLIERNFIGLVLFSVALFLIFGVPRIQSSDRPLLHGLLL